MKTKIKYLIIGVIVGVSFNVYSELNADYGEYGSNGSAVRGSVEWKPLYVYIVNE